MVQGPKFSATEEVDVGAIRGGQTDTNDNEVNTYDILVSYYGRRAFTTLVPAVDVSLLSTHGFSGPFHVFIIDVSLIYFVLFGIYG